MNGFITLHRKFLEWEWYDDANTMRLFVHCLLKANWKERKWRGEVIPRGSFITSLGKLSEELHLTRKQVMRSLDKLVSTGEVTKRGTAWTQITICKYDSYQDELQNKGTEREQTGNREGTEREQKGIQLNKETKKQSNNDLDGFEIVWDQYAKKVKKEPARKKWLKLKEKDREAIKSHIPNFVKANPEKKYRPDFITYLNQKRWMDEEAGVNGKTVDTKAIFQYLNQ